MKQVDIGSTELPIKPSLYSYRDSLEIRTETQCIADRFASFHLFNQGKTGVVLAKINSCPITLYGRTFRELRNKIEWCLCEPTWSEDGYLQRVADETS